MSQLIERLTTLIGHNSISSTQREHDQSNLPVIHSLAHWFEDLGFRVDIHPIPIFLVRPTYWPRWAQAQAG